MKGDFEFAKGFSPVADQPPIGTHTMASTNSHLTSAQPPKAHSGPIQKRNKSNSIGTSRESMMNRMVDALVGDDALDTLLEDEGPVTPPANPLADSPMIRDLSNSIGALTASDMVNQAQSWSSKSSTLNANASPFIRSMPSPHEDGWTRPNFGSHPSSPYQAAAAPQRGSPLVQFAHPNSTWHSNQSRDHTSASQPISLGTPSPHPGISNSFTPTMPSAFGDLGNIWGVSSTVPTAEWVRQKQPRYEDALTSSMLFGKRDDRWDTVASASAPKQATSPADRQVG